MKLRIKNVNQGFSSIYLTIFILVIIFETLALILFFNLNQMLISTNITKSFQSYYLAEAGIEDALFRLTNKLNFSTPYNIKITGGTSTVEISNIIGGIRTISATGNFLNRVRKVEVLYSISSKKISFYYGAQVGDGGMIMGNGSKVEGNVFSNGSITGRGTIQNNVVVAKNGNRIEGITVGENATVHTCKNSRIYGNLTYVSGGSVINCTVGGSTNIRPDAIDPLPLPIPQSQINKWKEDAAVGGVILNDMSITGTVSLGPVQIGTSSAPKNLTVQNGATLIVKGTIYVTGNIILNQGATLRLDNSYGSLSGILISDGVITVENNVIISGSGQQGSYVLLISTKPDVSNPVINIRNNSAGAVIYYANSGLIFLKNNMKAREVTGYKIQLENNAVIQYESGLENASFSSGPGGTWEVISWKEKE